MNTITAEQQEAIAAQLKDMILPVGLGSKESACSIAAINLALTGELTDDIPDCMSQVIGKWIIQVQDSMPDDFRNSRQWKALLPLAAGTGRERERERERLNIIMDWMWGTVLPTLQPIADRNGFGDAWLAMTTHRTRAAAKEAWTAAVATESATAAAAATYAATATATYAADAADAADAAAYAAATAETVAMVAAWADIDAWTTVDPCGLLDRLIRVGEKR